MNIFKKLFSGLLIYSFAFIQTAQTCTIFSLYPNGEHWIGRTFDWSYGHGMVYTNKRNVTKTSLKLLPTDVTSSWTSKYGSVTFNQFGREFPTGGMNEAGLVVDALELLTSIYPANDSRPSFNELQFIQYLLDNFKSVTEVSQELEKIRLSPVGSKLHYFVCDIKACMTIEYINGALVTHRLLNLPISGLANHSYEESVKYARNFVTFGGEREVVLNSKDSLDRFVRSNYNAKFINQYEDPKAALFGFLADVGSPSNRWQIIYNQDQKEIDFRVTSKIAHQRRVDLKKIDFDCHQTVKYFDLDSDFEGEVNTVLKDFDPEANLQVIKKSVEMQKLPAALAGRLAIYPNETVCN